MSGLAFKLLGQFEATYDEDQHLLFPTAKAKVLLAYLLVKDHFQQGINHQWGKLMLLLWPDILPESAQGKLRQTLYRLRQVLPEFEVKPGFSDSDRQYVSINPQVRYKLDVADFEQAIKRTTQESQNQPIEALSEAVAFYRGDFLGDVYVPDSQAFEQWAGQIRERLRRDTLAALYQIVECALDNKHYTQAEEMARRQIAVDELHEVAYRQLMIALAASGQRSEALAEFTCLTWLLADEFGVEPATETAMLAETIRQGQYDHGLLHAPDDHATSKTVSKE